MTAAKPVLIVRREDGALVEAALLSGLKPEDLLMIERQWSPARQRIFKALLASGSPRSHWPQSLHWNWERKISELRLLEASGFAVHWDGAWQGAMLTKDVSHCAQLPSERGKPLVYIDYLETAPWNWRIGALGQEGLYKGPGSVLFREALEHSVVEGFHGRVGLHALPQAERFYSEVCGMVPLGPDATKQDLVYFEFSGDKAQEFLSAGGG
jgi:hypothetical protein